MKVSSLVFACHSAACRPPTSGGTGGSNSSGGSRNRGPGGANPIAKLAPTKQLKVGSKRTIKDDDGASVGTVQRYKTHYQYTTKNGQQSGTAKTLASAIDVLKRARKSDEVHGARMTPTGQRSDAQKAAIKEHISSDRKRTAQQRASENVVQELLAQTGGKIKTKDIRFKSDGTIAIKGKDVRAPWGKMGSGGGSAAIRKTTNSRNGSTSWEVPAFLHLDKVTKGYKTQALAKNAIARFVNEVVDSSS